MKNYLNKIKTYIVLHKVTSVIILIAILLVGYWGYKKITSTTGETRYVTALVTKGTIISSVSGSGQVSASDQIDIKPSVSGTVTSVNVAPGDYVSEGKTLFIIDDKDAQKAVRNAEINLETANLDLEKFQQPADTVAVLGFKKAIADAETSKIDAEKTTKDKYRDLLNTSITASSSGSSDTQTPPTINGTYTKDQEVVISVNVYQTGNGAYFSVSSTPAGIVTGSGSVTTVTPQPIGDSGLYIKFATASPSQTTWTITLPNKIATAYNANYLAYQDALDNQKKVNDTADLTIAQNNKSLNDLYQPDTFTLKTKQLSVKQAENTLSDAKSTLSDYYVKAPFSGVMASVPIKRGDSASSGTTLGTIITSKRVAIISLNEVDVAKIALGQKATLSFDAIADLTISGKVVQIDSLGTVSSGVVNYAVKISFDTEDTRVKPGMSASAQIITNVKQNVLMVQNSAIKKQGTSNYVQMFDTPLTAPVTGTQGTISLVSPKNQTVETGVSDSTSTEITSGLKEGDQIVTKTITTTSTTTASAPSLLNAVSGNTKGATGGNAARALGR